MSPPPPRGLRGLMESFTEEVGLILSVFSENCWILICLVIDPLTWLTLYECVWEFFGSTVTSLYSGHCKELELVSSLARVRNSGSLFQSNVCIL